MKKRYTIMLTLIIIVILSGIILLFSSLLSGNTEVEENNVLDKIEKYNYSLKKENTELYKEKYYELKDELKKSNIDNDTYAKLVTELFIIDLYSMNNKSNKYDVGGVDFVFDDVKENYKLNVSDTLYKYLNEEDINKYPSVTNVEIKEIKEDIYTYNEKEYDGYEVLVSWDYDNDFGYDKEATLKLVKDNDKISVVSYKGVAISDDEDN